MKKKNALTFFEKLEEKSELLKKWGDDYRLEKKIIQNIIEARNKKGLTQKELGDLVGLNQSAIARIEAQAHSPRLNTIIKLVDALDLKIEIIDKNVEFFENKFYQNFLEEFYKFNSKENNLKKEDIYVYKGEEKNEIQTYRYSC
ncbi:MAG: helix-turn-helix transcriptional regulator [Acholeplasmataceae bacterium]|jgi:transcriptional regulator with XRE-family HTH domain|nr:helix-turn-helix transcriptional regulator [Acholeplasmataceae bacterium]